MKICSICKNEYEDDNFYRGSQCKPCVKHRSKLYRESHKDYYREYNKKYRETYVYDKERDRAKSLRWRNKNIQKARDIYKKWHSENIEYVKKYKSKYRKKNKLKILEYNRKYSKSNRERINNNTRRRYNENPFKVKYYNRTRVSKMKNTDDGSVTYRSVKDILISQGNRCNHCKKLILGRYEVDHIYPLSKGGTHTIDNIQLLCKSCNCSKGNRIIEFNKLSI